jgi:nucleoside-diphosphate-sugar epimerase
MSVVTITGGAGNLGRQVAFLLAARGYNVRILDLPEIDYGFAAGTPGLEVIPGDLR